MLEIKSKATSAVCSNAFLLCDMIPLLTKYIMYVNSTPQTLANIYLLRSHAMEKCVIYIQALSLYSRVRGDDGRLEANTQGGEQVSLAVAALPSVELHIHDRFFLLTAEFVHGKKCEDGFYFVALQIDYVIL